MTPAVRIVMMLVALAVIGMGAAVVVLADGWPRWLIGAVMVTGGFACIGGAATEGTKSESDAGKIVL